MRKNPQIKSSIGTTLNKRNGKTVIGTNQELSTVAMQSTKIPRGIERIKENKKVLLTCDGVLKDNHKDGKPKNNKIDTRKFTLMANDNTTDAIGNKISRKISNFFKNF